MSIVKAVLEECGLEKIQDGFVNLEGKKVRYRYSAHISILLSNYIVRPGYSLSECVGNGYGEELNVSIASGECTVEMSIQPLVG